MREIRTALLALAILPAPAICWAQTQLVQQPLTAHNEEAPATVSGNAATDPSDEAPVIQANKPNKKDDSQGQQTKRMFWVVPNFAAVDADAQLPALPTREKFALAAHDGLVDYSTFTWTGILAADFLRQ